MIYRILRFLTRFVLMAYYRKIYISGADRIPAHKPVLLACNHPNSFMDAIVMAIMLERPLHFLTRSDMFNTPLKQWLLARVNMIPIYRLKEGAENLYKNKDTFEKCHQILQQGGMVLIFSEGACVHEKRLRTLKKGTARLAFGAEEASNGQLDLQVIPVGINYSHPTLFRKEMMIGIAPPIELKDLLPEYCENPAKAINTFNERLTNGLSLNVIEQSKGTEQLTEQLFVLNRSDDPSFESRYWLSPSHHRLYNEKVIAKQVNELYSKHPEAFTVLATQAASYFKQLESYRLHDRDIANTSTVPFSSFLLAILGLPIFVLGYILNYIPARTASKIADTKVRRVEFFSSVRMTVGFFLYMMYYILVVVGVSCISARTGAVLFFILPASGYLALLYRDLFLRLASALKFRKMQRKNKELTEGLLQTRKRLSKVCEELHIHKSVTIV